MEIKKLQQALGSANDSLLQVDQLNRIGFLFYERNIDSTFYYTNKARGIASRHQYKKGTADALNNIGVTYDVKGYPHLAINYYNKAHKIYTEIDDTSNQVQTIMNMAMVYSVLGNAPKTKQYFNAAFDAGLNLGKDSIMSLVYYNYLLNYEDVLNDDSVGYYINKANAIAVKFADTRTLIAIASAKAAHLIRKGQTSEGIVLLEKAIEDAQGQQLYFASLDMISSLGDHLLQVDSLKTKAVQYYQQGLNLAQKNDYLMYISRFSKKLFEFYNTVKDVEKELYYSKVYNQSLEKENSIENTSAIDYADYAIKEEELEVVKTREHLNLLLLVFTCVLAVAALIFILVVKKNLDKTKKLNRIVIDQNTTLQQTLTGLEQSHAENTQMMKVVAHDLRGPAAGISGIAEILLEESARNAEDQEMLHLIKDSANKLIELANDLLIVKTNARDLKKEVTDIGELLQQCVSLFAGTAREKQQTIDLNAFSASIFASREKLWRVISNLIANAIKFSPSGKRIFVILEDQGDNVLISVKDSGIGIPDQLGDKIFQPGANAGRAGTQGEQSFGMGLAISKQIVEAHQGNIWFGPNPEGGTIFYVQLPKLLPGKMTRVQATV